MQRNCSLFSSLLLHLQNGLVDTAVTAREKSTFLSSSKIPLSYMCRSSYKINMNQALSMLEHECPFHGVPEKLLWPVAQS